MERAIGIIKREIEKRESMLLNEEYFLRTNQIKCEIKSLNKALKVVNKNYLLQRVSNAKRTFCNNCKSGLIDYPEIGRRTCRCGALGYNVTE